MEVPILVSVGRFGPHAPRPLVDEIADTLSASFVIELPNLGRNTLSTNCAIELFHAWFGNPASPPDTACISREPTIEFLGT